MILGQCKWISVKGDDCSGNVVAVTDGVSLLKTPLNVDELDCNINSTLSWHAPQELSARDMAIYEAVADLGSYDPSEIISVVASYRFGYLANKAAIEEVNNGQVLNFHGSQKDPMHFPYIANVLLGGEEFPVVVFSQVGAWLNVVTLQSILTKNGFIQPYQMMEVANNKVINGTSWVNYT